jgi:hypothetical protein
MADLLKQWCTIKDLEGNVLSHEASYEVTYEDKSNSFVVVIQANDMIDPHDLDEAKIKANLQASLIKARWIASIPFPLIELKESPLGEVTL